MQVATQVQSIDESMILFKGRSSLKQFNRKKPIKRGFKLRCREQTCPNLYISLTFIKEKTDIDKSKIELELRGNVVDEITKNLSGKNHIITMDNYLSSIPLFEYLKTKNIYAVGTVSNDRSGLPKLIDNKKMKRGASSTIKYRIKVVVNFVH
ncbi:piggyBac transposable element-derived protein 3 [Trichonephila clavipes]|nr:piggyBac transposable element-derived protein 3 [Trichonephila clavipes]